MSNLCINLHDKIITVIGTEILTIDEIMKRLMNQFPETVVDIKAEYNGPRANEEFLNYVAYKKLESRTRYRLNLEGMFRIVGIYSKRYANTTA
jgi:hypothetical protein